MLLLCLTWAHTLGLPQIYFNSLPSTHPLFPSLKNKSTQSMKICCCHDFNPTSKIYWNEHLIAIIVIKSRIGDSLCKIDKNSTCRLCVHCNHMLNKLLKFDHMALVWYTYKKQYGGYITLGTMYLFEEESESADDSQGIKPMRCWSIQSSHCQLFNNGIAISVEKSFTLKTESNNDVKIKSNWIMYLQNCDTPTRPR